MVFNYLSEQLQQSLNEYTFTSIKPDNYKFYGIEALNVKANNSGDAIAQCIGPYISAYDNTMYDIEIKTVIKFPKIRNDSGFIRYDKVGSKLKPTLVLNDDEEYNLTNKIISSNDGVSNFIRNEAKNIRSQVKLDFSFDISENDPKFNDEMSFQTLNLGGAGHVRRMISTVSYVIKDYITNFQEFVVDDINTQIFGKEYTTFTSQNKYFLVEIEFIGKQDYEGDMRRTNIYKSWWDDVGHEMGNMVGMNVNDVDFTIKYKNTQIV
jgi:hypothetical protein